MFVFIERDKKRTLNTSSTTHNCHGHDGIERWKNNTTSLKTPRSGSTSGGVTDQITLKTFCMCPNF